VSDVNLQVVREFFELNLFHVLTNWQHDAALARFPDPRIQLFVKNARASAGDAQVDRLLLRPEDLPRIPRAVVEVRAWHADRFYPSVIESSPVLGQFAAEEALAFAAEVFGTREFVTILVISELPASTDNRQRAIQLIEALGIDHVIEFPVILQDVLDRISATGNYASPTLQTLRLLKRYGFIRRQQLEFAFPTEAPLASAAPRLDTAEVPEEDE